jgi:hypothetical protein
MKKIVLIFIPAVLASAVGFLIHVSTLGPITAWVAQRMTGQVLDRNSLAVTGIAFLTSVEIGIGVVIVYLSLRKSLSTTNVWLRALVLWILLLAVQGRLVRQPFMDLFIGNPLSVVALQDGITYLLWFAMSIVVVWMVEVLDKRHAPRR